MAIGFYEPLEGMESEACTFCEKTEPQCDVLIQDEKPGGSYRLAHLTCLRGFMEERKDGDPNTKQPEDTPGQPEER